MPNDEMWKWLINPFFGVKAGNVPTTLKMRKGPDLTLHRDPSAPDGDQGQGSGQNNRPLPTDAGKDDKNKGNGADSPPGRNPDKEETEKRDEQQREQQGKNPSKDRAGEAAKKLLEYAKTKLEKMSDKELDGLAKDVALTLAK